MRMKFYLMGLFIALIGFTACSDDLNPGVDPINPPTNDDEVEIVVNLQKPGTGAVPYSTIWIDKEALVDTLDVYVFSDKKERDGHPGKYTLEKIVPQDTSKAVSVGGNISLQLKLDGRTFNRKLYFIANGASINSLLFLDEIGYTTEDEFLAALTNKAPQGTPLLMTAAATITAAELATVGLDNKYKLTDDVLLKRVSARIDIENHERLLIIDSVQLFNTPEQSYIIKQPTSDAVENSVAINTTWPTLNIREHKMSDGAAKDSFWKVPIRHDDPAIGDSVYIPSLYFPYENFAGGDKAKRQRLRIWGRIGSGDLTQPGTGNDVTWEVPLQATGDSIARNHRYILLIYNVLGSDLDAEFKVKPWESEEGDTIIQEIDADYPNVTNGGVRLPGKTLNVVQAGETITLKVDCNIQWAVEFEGDDAATAGSWITPVITMDAAGNTAAGANDIGKYLQLTFGANATGSERGYGNVWIKVYNKADPGKMYRFTIKQA